MSWMKPLGADQRKAGDDADPDDERRDVVHLDPTRSEAGWRPGPRPTCRTTETKRPMPTAAGPILREQGDADHPS